MSHIPYYGEDTDDEVVVKDFYYQKFGPWRNTWGYELEMAVIDDLYILKARTPCDGYQVSYHWSEEALEKKLDLYNQDRRF